MSIVLLMDGKRILIDFRSKTNLLLTLLIASALQNTFSDNQLDLPFECKDAVEIQMVLNIRQFGYLVMVLCHLVWFTNLGFSQFNYSQTQLLRKARDRPNLFVITGWFCVVKWSFRIDIFCS